jgi:tetratricopeptide (TPR) repeat protein
VTYSAWMSLGDEIDRTLRTCRYLDGPAGAEYAKNAEPVVAALAELAQAGRAEEAIQLTERALTILVEVLGRADDWAGMIGDLVRRLLDIHLDASRAARAAGRPGGQGGQGRDPLRLAAWLVRFGLDDQDWFAVDVDTYAEPLGAAGVALYREEVDRRWSAGDRSFGVRRAKERLAFLDRDIDTLVELLGGNLASSRQYLHVAAAMRQLDRYDDALSWALRGVAERPDPLVGKLYDFAVTEHLRRGNTEEALALRRRQHRHQRTEASYLALRSIARAVGTWADDGPAALALIEGKHSSSVQH